MKVLFISRLYPNELNPRSGAVIHNQAKELKKNGIDVGVISPTPYVPKLIKSKREKWIEYYSLPKKQIYEGVKVWYPRFFDLPFSKFDVYRGRAVINATKIVVDQVYKIFPFDLIHTHMAYPENSIGVYLKRKYNVPLITTIRSTDMDVSLKRNNLKYKIYQSLKQTDLVISPSPQLSDKLFYNFNIESVHIGNGIYPQITDKHDNVNFVNEKEFNGKKLVLSISNLIKSKGIQHNILAMKELIIENPNIIYLIIGDGPYRKVLEDQVEKLDLMDSVFFLGELSHQEAMNYLSICDVFSMPSFRETFGLVYLEAMYYKKPIILCEGQGVDGVVKNKESAMIVPPHSVDSIIDSINSLLNDNVLKEKLVDKGYKIVKENYTWNKIGNSLKKEYNNFFN